MNEQALIRQIRRTGALEGAPEYVIEEAISIGQTLLRHTSPLHSIPPSEVRCIAEDYLRRRTNRQEQNLD